MYRNQNVKFLFSRYMLEVLYYSSKKINIAPIETWQFLNTTAKDKKDRAIVIVSLYIGSISLYWAQNTSLKTMLLKRQRKS